MALKFERATFGTRDEAHSTTPKETKTGVIATCEECESKEFMVFQLDGHNHFHLQCSVCGISYCPFGVCK